MNEQRTPNTNTQPDDLRQARALARKRRRRKLMIMRTAIVATIVLLIGLITLGVVFKIVADQKSARGEKVGFLAVQEIVVEGDTRYSDEEIIKASNLYVGQSLLSVNKVKAHAALTAAFPYLDTVEVGNNSFYSLHIRVTEVPVMAVVEREDGWMILGDNNRALELVTDEQIPADVVRIKGATYENEAVGKSLLDERSLRICRALVGAAGRYGLDSMTTIDISSKTKISILLNDRMQVVLGNETNLENQVRALTGLLPSLYNNNGEDAAGRLDMIFYSDEDKSNDKAIYTPQEVLDKLSQTQQKPMAAVQVGEAWTLINDENVALEFLMEESLPEGLVRVVGASCEINVVGKELLDSRTLKSLNTILKSAGEHDAIHVTTIDVTDKTAITLRLEEGLTVLLGDSSALSVQMDALAAALPNVWEDHGEDADGTLDLSSYGDDDDSNDSPVYQAKKK